MSRRSRAQAHAKHYDTCSCGRVVHGNGARYQHRQMHVRRGDGHHPINEDLWREAMEKKALAAPAAASPAAAPAAETHAFDPVWFNDISQSEYCEHCGKTRAEHAPPSEPAAPAPDLRKECGDNSPVWWSCRWRDWHRGHGCGKDDGKPCTSEGAAEFAAHGRLPGRVTSAPVQRAEKRIAELERALRELSLRASDPDLLRGIFGARLMLEGAVKEADALLAAHTATHSLPGDGSAET